VCQKNLNGGELQCERKLWGPKYLGTTNTKETYANPLLPLVTFLPITKELRKPRKTHKISTLHVTIFNPRCPFPTQGLWIGRQEWRRNREGPHTWRCTPLSSPKPMVQIKRRPTYMKVYTFVFVKTHGANHWQTTTFVLVNSKPWRSYFAIVSEQAPSLLLLAWAHANLRPHFAPKT
jgi:hypothetical protein